MQNAKLLVITLVLTLAFVFGFSWIAQKWLEPSSTGSQYSKTATSEELLTATPHSIGAGPDAPYTIVEFSDFICPACGSVSPTLQALVDTYPDKVRLVYRHFPLTNIHPAASILAEISEAADDQGKFWEMHDFIFAHQQSDLENMSPEEATQFIQDHADEIGVNWEQIQQDLDSGEPAKRVEEDRRQAELLQLNFTPSIFLNGQLMPIDQVQSTIKAGQ